MNTPHRTVTLQFRNDPSQGSASLRADLSPAEVEMLQQQAERLGLPRHPDPSVAALLAAVRVRNDVPTALYAAMAAVLSRVYAAANNKKGTAANTQ